jgi:hypothetical protein
MDEDFDIEAIGFELPEPEIEPEPDDAPSIEEVEHRTKLGQLWKLGDHLFIAVTQQKRQLLPA